MIKAILFDLDNTLIDFGKMKRMSIDSAVDAMIDAGLEMDKEDAISKLFYLYEKHGIEHQNIFDVFLKETIGHIDYKIMGNAIAAYRKTKLAYLEPFPHVIPTLTRISRKGIGLGVVTDAPSLQAWIRLCSLKLHHIFDVVVTFDDTGRTKDDGLPFKRAVEKLNLKPANVLMVGDWPEGDIHGAKKYGMKTAFARYGANKKTKESGADYEISGIEELIGIIEMT